jgi:hypothetical protein
VKYGYFIFILLTSVNAFAGAVLDINYLMFSDGMKSATTDEYSATAMNGFLGFSVDKKGYFILGWNYDSVATSNKVDTTTTEYSSTQMGPGLVIYMDKDHTWRLSAAYNIETLATYKTTGSTEEEWSGTSISGSLGYQIRFTESLSIGLRLNYNSASFASQLIGTTQEDVSYTKDLMYPSIAFAYEDL